MVDFLGVIIEVVEDCVFGLKVVSFGEESLVLKFMSIWDESLSLKFVEVVEWYVKLLSDIGKIGEDWVVWMG